MSQNIHLRVGLLPLSLKCAYHRIVPGSQAVVCNVCDSAVQFAMACLEDPEVKSEETLSPRG